MENLPAYISIVFALTAIATLAMLYRAANSRKMVTVIVAWLLLQTVISLAGFYKITTGVPPRFALLLIPPVVFITMQFITRSGRAFIDQIDVKALTLIHVARIPVEITLFWLFVHHAVPEAMTFEGCNFDIFSGLTVPSIYYFGYVKRVLGPRVLLAWNIVCLLLLANIVATAVLSAPFSFQQLGFEQPNIALLYFPFVWLPGFVVPAVLFTHLVSIRQLIRTPSEKI